jgi:hypothetical protein
MRDSIPDALAQKLWSIEKELAAIGLDGLATAPIAADAQKRLEALWGRAQLELEDHSGLWCLVDSLFRASWSLLRRKPS